MSGNFGAVYASAYDSFYADKDYAAECDLIEQVFARFATSPVRSVLDMGCGTGGHAVPLAARGLRVTGCDRSEEMLAGARAKTRELPAAASLQLVAGDVRSLDLDTRFDAALLMFAVLGYQTSNADVQAALATARRHLLPGGLLVFDVWYGPAVLAQGPGERVRVIDDGDHTWLRAASAEVDVHHHVCAVRYRLWEMRAERVTSRAEEVHRMRFFFPQELELLLQGAGFELLRIGAFPDFDADPDASTWNVLVAARLV